MSNNTEIDTNTLNKLYDIFDIIWEKCKKGEMTIGQVLEFASMEAKQRDAMFFNSNGKFREALDLGIINVLQDYAHDKATAAFVAKHPTWFRLGPYHKTGYTIPRPSRIAQPGEQFQVKLIEVTAEEVTPIECIDFLKEVGGVHINHWGVLLVLDQKQTELKSIEKRVEFVSWDTEKHLFQDREEDFVSPHLVPTGFYDPHAKPETGYSFQLITEAILRQGNFFLCFTPVTKA